MSFLVADPDVRALIQTLPDPPRVFPNAAPPEMPADQPHIVYWMMSRLEGESHSGPSGLGNASIMLECRVRAASMKMARLLSKRVKDCRGPVPLGNKLHGFRGNFPNGYFVQKASITDMKYQYDRSVKAGELGTHVVMVEVQLFWNI